MGLVRFEGHDDNLVTAQYSAGLGPVLRSDHSEVARVFYAKGTGADVHQHPEEQTFYCVEGLMECTVNGDTYMLHPGEASFHPSNVPHKVYAVEDTVVISFKARVGDQIYNATGQLG